MKYNIHGHNLKVTDGIKEKIKEKLSKIDKYFKKNSEIEAKVVLRVTGKDQIIEVTIPINNYIIRAEERDTDLYNAIDMVVNKLEKQLKKNKTRMQKKFNKESIKEINFESYEGTSNFEKEEIIEKYKKIEMKPMDEEEAIMQMELLNHDFFIFRDSENCEVKLVYKRKDGKYGIIEAV